LELISIDGPSRSRSGGTTETVTGQVNALRERGPVAPAIADTLNIGERRVREILAA
jgi:hypothetical protein